MRSVIIVGMVAGIITGIVRAPLGQVFPDTAYMTALVEVVYGVIWGIILCAFYAYFYGNIPGKGVRKGFVFSLMIWLAGIARPAALAASHGLYVWAGEYVFVGAAQFVIFGLVLGALYKK